MLVAYTEMKVSLLVFCYVFYNMNLKLVWEVLYGYEIYIVLVLVFVFLILFVMLFYKLWKNFGDQCLNSAHWILKIS